MSDEWLILILALSGIIGYRLICLIDRLFHRHTSAGKHSKRERD